MYGSTRLRQWTQVIIFSELEFGLRTLTFMTRVHNNLEVGKTFVFLYFFFICLGKLLHILNRIRVLMFQDSHSN